ncbi:MAG: MotA/TolQ/ExbB proton channel family protein [Myxococcota bacterium]|jgi:biopolymer transport protein ExbB|nr:MotA/TolQ/ExbB proton channel family protein [Myxococcota bacterium]
MNIVKTFLDFALLGAEWVMWVLVALSVLSIAIMFERAIFFFGKRPSLGGLVDELRTLVQKNDLGAAKSLVGGKKGVAFHVAESVLSIAGEGPRAVDELASAQLIAQRLRLEHNLAFLGTVGNNAPFIGLFGTVIGIIQAFHDLSLNTQGGASTVMSGISEALVATAIGLLVAIPAVIAYNLFQRRIKAIMSDSDALVRVIISGLEGRGAAGGK